MRTPAAFAPADKPNDLKSLIRSSVFGSTYFPKTGWNDHSLGAQNLSSRFYGNDHSTAPIRSTSLENSGVLTKSSLPSAFQFQPMKRANFELDEENTSTHEESDSDFSPLHFSSSPVQSQPTNLFTS